MTYKISIYDHSTGKQIEREMTLEEKDQYNLEIDLNQQLQAEKELKEENERNL
jgi:hypothetical protein